MQNDNDMILARMRGVAAQASTPNDLVDPQNPSRRETRRWHIQTGGARDLLICAGDHPPDSPCEFHRYRYVAKSKMDQGLPTHHDVRGILKVVD